MGTKGTGFRRQGIGWQPGGIVAVLILANLARPAIGSAMTAETTRSFGLGSPEEVFSTEAQRLHLTGAFARVGIRRLGVDAEEGSRGPQVGRRNSHASIFDAPTLRTLAVVLVGVPLVGYFAWWSGDHQAWHFRNEGWFQSYTYAGGADKASHLTFSYMGTQALIGWYRSLGHSDTQARWLALGTTAIAGIIVEIGDGFTQYGFSWEDATTNVIGALLATQIDRLGWRDSFGMRWGLVKTLKPDSCCRAGINYGDDYSKEIYTADFKLVGVLPRFGVRPGPARFLLLSVTYGSKGYRFSPPENRERNLGLEIGLNFEQILRGIGVPEHRWWGKALYVIATHVRLPYTGWGIRYNFDQGRWSGPDFGDTFDPGSVIYD
jgi:Predicted periplasmic lipoprotein (DUF2279)